MGAPKLESYRTAGIPVLLGQTGALSDDHVHEFLAGLGVVLEGIQNDFRLQIEKNEIHVLTANPAMAQSVRIAIEPLLGQLPEPVSLVASNCMGWEAMKKAMPGMGQDQDEVLAEELPPGLSRNSLKAKNKLSASKTRRDLEGKLASLIHEHLQGDSGKALAICLWGPPGSGKTTLALECARQAGFETFLMSGDYQTKYTGESAKRLTKIFDFLRMRKSVVIFDEIDNLVGRRGTDGESATLDHNLTVGTLYRELEKTQVVLLGTTNLQGGLDQGYMSRVGRNLYSMPAADLDERHAFLEEANPGFRPPLDKNELVELAKGAEGCSFRDMEALCVCLGEAHDLLLPGSVVAWRKAFKGRKGRGPDGPIDPSEQWGKAIPSAISLDKIIWHLCSPRHDSEVLVSSKSDCCCIGHIGQTGHLGVITKVAAPDDVNAACLSADNLRLILSTDDGAIAVKRNNRGDKDVLDLGGNVWDTVQIGTSPYFMSISDDGDRVDLWSMEDKWTITSCLDSVSGYEKLRSIHYLGSAGNTCTILAGGLSELAILKMNHPCPTKGSLVRVRTVKIGNQTGNHRIALLQLADAEFLAAFPAEGRVAIWRIDGTWNPECVHQFHIGDKKSTPVCAFDASTGRLAIGLTNEIRIIDDCLRADGDSKQTIAHDPDWGDITALCFGQYGRVLIWGTKDGKVYTSLRNGF